MDGSNVFCSDPGYPKLAWFNEKDQWASRKMLYFVNGQNLRLTLSMAMFIASSKLFSIKVFISLSCTKNQWVFFSKHGTAIIKYFLISEGKNTGFFCFCFKRNCYILWWFKSLNSFTSVIKIIGISYFPIDIDMRSFIKFDLKKRIRIFKKILYINWLPKFEWQFFALMMSWN